MRIHAPILATGGVSPIHGLVLGLSIPLGAQEVTGRLQSIEPGRSAVGVVITATRVHDGALVARALAGANGAFRLQVTSDSLLIRALRIGQEPVVLARVRLGEGERYTVDMVLPNAPVRLAVHHTRVTDRCQVRSEGRDVVAALFSAARGTVLATGATTTDGTPRAAFEVVTEHMNARGERVDSLRTVDVQLAESAQPFRSVPVDSLLSAGWVVSQPDGSTLYRGLDAEVLLDDRFLSRYCLQLARDSVEAPDLVGVQFRPARPRQGVPDVEGVLWLDREYHTLRELTFRYTGLDAVSASTKPGGAIEFSSLPNGISFVSAWSLRMPVVARAVSVQAGTRAGAASRISERRSLMGQREVVGRVAWMETDGRVQFVRPAPLAVGAASIAPRRDVERQLSGESCHLHGRVLAESGTPLAHATVEVLDHASSGRGEAPLLLDLARADSTGRFLLCPSVSPRSLLLRLHADGRPSDSVVIGAASSADPHGVTLVHSREGFLMASAIDSGVDSDDAEREAAVESSASSAADDTMRSDANSGGAVLLRRNAMARENSRSARDGGAASIAWLHVVDRDSISIPFATVVMSGGSARITAPDGRVQLPRTVRGDLDVEVRRIGYAPFIGRVAPDSSDGMYRVQLAPTAQTLTAVDVVAPRFTELSRTGFYDRADRVRRGAILGSFLTPEEIERRSFGSAANLLAGMQYVWMNPDGTAGGRGGCTHQVLVDGRPGGSLGMISANEVMAIEVYPSTANAPVELIPLTNRGSCGIVAVWLGPRR